MTREEREAYARLLMAVRTSLEAAHQNVTGVLQLLNAGEAEPKQPEKKRPRFLGDDVTQTGA